MCREERTTVCACTLCPCTGATYLYLCGSWANPNQPCLNRRVYTFTPPLTLVCPTCISGQHNRHPAWTSPTTGIAVPFWRAYDPVTVFWNGLDTDEQIRSYVYQRDGLPAAWKRTYLGDMGFGDLELDEPNTIPRLLPDVIFPLKPDMMAPPISQVFATGWRMPDGSSVGTTVKTSCDGLLVPPPLMARSETVRYDPLSQMMPSQIPNVRLSSIPRASNSHVPMAFNPQLPAAVHAAGSQYLAAAASMVSAPNHNGFLSGMQSPTASLAGKTQLLTLQARQRANSALNPKVRYAPTTGSAGLVGPSGVLAHPKVGNLRANNAGWAPGRALRHVGSLPKIQTTLKGKVARKNLVPLEDDSAPASPSTPSTPLTRSLRPRKVKTYMDETPESDDEDDDEDEADGSDDEDSEDESSGEDAGAEGESDDAEGEDEDAEGEDEEMELDEPAKAEEKSQQPQQPQQKAGEPPLKRRKVEAPVVQRPRTRAQTLSAAVIDLAIPKRTAPSKGKRASQRQRALTAATGPTRTSARLRKK